MNPDFKYVRVLRFINVTFFFCKKLLISMYLKVSGFVFILSLTFYTGFNGPPVQLFLSINLVPVFAFVLL